MKGKILDVFGREQRRVISSSKTRKKQSKSGEDAEKTNRCKLVGGGDLHNCFPPHLDNKSTCDAVVPYILVLFHNVIIYLAILKGSNRAKRLSSFLARFQAKTMSEMEVAL